MGTMMSGLIATLDNPLLTHRHQRQSGQPTKPQTERFYLLLFLQFHDCSDKLGDRLTREQRGSNNIL